MKRVEVQGNVVSIENPRDVQTKFGPGQVAQATVQDESGSVALVLWNEKIKQISEGDRITVNNGYVDSFRGQLQLQVGRYGTISVQRQGSL